jgi:arsenate reductase
LNINATDSQSPTLTVVIDNQSQLQAMKEEFSPVAKSAKRRARRPGMKATIWHNPNCGTSRKTLEILRDTPGVEVEVIEYLKTPPSRATLAALYSGAGITARQGLRTRGSPAEELGLLDASDDAILDAMAREPILIERPLVRTDKGVRLCRPQDVVRDIL